MADFYSDQKKLFHRLITLVSERFRTPAAHLDGDGEQLPLLVQVEEAQRRRQVRLLSVDLIGRHAVQNLVVQQVDGPFLPHRDRAAVTKCCAGTDSRAEEGTRTCSSRSTEEPSGRKGRSMSEVTARFGGRRRL